MEWGRGAKGSRKDIPEKAPRRTFPALSSAARGSSVTAAGPGRTWEQQMRFKVGELGS